LAKDLAAPESPEEVFRELEAAGVAVDVLVNNAGFGTFGPFAEAPLDKELEELQLNVVTLTHLTKKFLPGMLARRRGGVLNVASTAGFQPGPLMAVYYATKAYVLSFTEAMRAELAPHGVRVTVLCPGPVPSEFQARAGFGPGFDSAVLNVLPAAVAQQAYRGLMANKRAVMPGLGIKIVPFLLRFFPRGFILGAVGRLQLRQR
jgi:short-subunit dehydrogenase